LVLLSNTTPCGSISSVVLSVPTAAQPCSVAVTVSFGSSSMVPSPVVTTCVRASLVGTLGWMRNTPEFGAVSTAV
jgi:hypothetical protein